jgi:hypothetical protein
LWLFKGKGSLYLPGPASQPTVFAGVLRFDLSTRRFEPMGVVDARTYVAAGASPCVPTSGP